MYPPPPLSITVIIPALNEERCIEDTVREVQRVVPRYFVMWEIFIFNDGSTDHTGPVAERLALFDENIRVFHHDTPKNLGACYREGIEQASYDHVILIPGDNECGPGVMRRIFEAAGKADIIVPYVVNPEVRPISRRLLSRAFVSVVNLLSGCRLRYYNGTVLHKTELVRSAIPRTDGFAYQAEILVKLLRGGYSYQEVGVELSQRGAGKSKAFNLVNILQVIRLLAKLPSK